MKPSPSPERNRRRAHLRDVLLGRRPTRATQQHRRLFFESLEQRTLLSSIRGIDRWWAYPGATFPVELAVQVTRPDRYDFDIDFDDPLSASDFGLSQGANAASDVGVLDAISFDGSFHLELASEGLHTIRISNFVAPSHTALETVRFYLDGPDGIEDAYTTTFIADRRGVTNADVAALTFEDGFGEILFPPIDSLNALIDEYAPALRFERTPSWYVATGEHYTQPVSVAATLRDASFRDEHNRLVRDPTGTLLSPLMPIRRLCSLV